MSLKITKVLFLVFFAVAVIFVSEGKCEEANKDVEESGRTFGHHFLKRMSFAVLPIMYKMGMMTTLLITLTIMSTKGLAIGVLLLILGISQIIARTFTAVPALPPPIAAPLAAPLPPPVYPVVYQKAADWPIYPVVQKAVPVAHAHAHAIPAAGWAAKVAYNPYAREDTEENPEYVEKH